MFDGERNKTRIEKNRILSEKLHFHIHCYVVKLCVFRLLKVSIYICKRKFLYIIYTITIVHICVCTYIIIYFPMKTFYNIQHKVQFSESKINLNMYIAIYNMFYAY